MTSSESTNVLRELSRVLQKNIPARSRTLSRQLLSKRNPAAALFEGFFTESGRTETDIARSVGSTNNRDRKYLSKKKYFQELLLNSLFVLDLKKENYSNLARTEYKNDKEVFIAKTLTWLGARTTARIIAERGLRVATEFEYWSNAEELSKILRWQAAWAGDARMHKYYHDESIRFSKLRFVQGLASSFYEDVTLAAARSGAELKGFEAQLSFNLKKLKRWNLRFDTFGLALSVFRLEACLFQSRGDYAAALESTVQFEESLRSRFVNFYTQARAAELALKRLACAVAIRDFDSGNQAAIQCEHNIPTGSNNWFGYREYQFLLLMNSLEFKAAQEILQGTLHDPRFSDQEELRIERWELYSLYLDYALGKENRVQDPESFETLVSGYAKDKAGFHALLLILQILVSIDKGDLNYVIGRMEALKVYRSRYLKADESKQVDLFFRLLSILESNSFNPVLAEERGSAVAMKLQEEAREVLQGLQIIPLDWLWHHIIEKLKKKNSR